METQDLIDRITKDAKSESAKLLREATKTAKANIDFAQKHADELIKEAKENSKKAQNSGNEINIGIADLYRRLEMLRTKTEIVDKVFDDAINSVDYNFRIEKNTNYNLVLTKDELCGILREQIEKPVTEILFNE